MTRIVGRSLYFVGLLSMIAVTYAAIAFRSYGVLTASNSLVWPFYSVGLIVALLLCEAGRLNVGKGQRTLLKIQFGFLAGNVAWYVVSGLAGS